MNSSPDWLPDGWVFEVRTQKGGANTGRNIKSYYDPLTESRFYSKKAVFRYLEAQKGCSPNTKRTRTSSRRSIIEAVTLTAQENAPDGLPHGWIKEIRFRNTKSQVKKDLLYIDPVSGYIIRSLNDVFRYLKTGDIFQCAMRPMKRRLSDACALNQPSATAAKGPEFCGAVTKRCRYSDEKPDKNVSIDIGMVDSPERSYKPCNGDASCTEKLNLTCKGGNSEENKVAAMINSHYEVASSNKDQSQTKNKGQGNQSHLKKTRAFTLPVRASKRLAALIADSATTSETVEALPGAIVQCSDKLKAESSKGLDRAGSTAKLDHHEPSRIVLEPSLQVKKSKVTRSSTMSVQAYKQLAALGAGLIISKSLDAFAGPTIDNPDKLKAESDKVLDLSAGPTKKFDHKESSTKVLLSSVKQKKTKATKASTMPVRASKRLADLRAGTLTTSAVVKVLPGAMIDHYDKLKAESGKILDHSSVPTENIDHQESSTLVPGQYQNAKKNKAAKASILALQASNQLAASGSNSLTIPATVEVLSEAAIKHLNHLKEKPAEAAIKHLNHLKEKPAEALDREAGSTEKLDHPRYSPPTPPGPSDNLPTPPDPSDNLPTPPVLSDNLSCHKPDDKLPPNIQFETLNTRKEDSGFISPFGDSWPDPCIEFAFKTLTGDIPFFDDTLTFHDYFNQQLESDISPDLGASLGSTKLENMNENKHLSPLDPWSQHILNAKDDGRPSSLGNGAQPIIKFN